MKIKMLVSTSFKAKRFEIGKIYEVEAAIGKHWVSKNIAKEEKKTPKK